MFKEIKLWLIYSVLPITATEQSDPVMYVCVCVCVCVCACVHKIFLILSAIMLQPMRLDRVPCALE